MKKLLTLVAAVLLNMTVAEAETPLFDEASSFQIAKAVKLGDSTDDMGTVGRVVKKATDLALCQSDDDCSPTQKCEKKRCVKVCGYAACTGTTPDCTAENHKAVCKCTEASCAAGYKCGTDGACVKCETGEKCGCSGSQVSDGKGGCYCTGSSSCPAGQQYSAEECACLIKKAKKATVQAIRWRTAQAAVCAEPLKAVPRDRTGIPRFASAKAAKPATMTAVKIRVRRELCPTAKANVRFSHVRRIRIAARVSNAKIPRLLRPNV